MAVRLSCRWLGVGLMILWLGCEADSPQDQPGVIDAPTDTDTDAGAREPSSPSTPGADKTGDTAQLDDPCAAGAMTRTPASVSDIVDHINMLPKPVSLPCLLTSLPRPLQLHATRSILSAQPAVGPRSPRIFIFYNELILSVALAGMGQHLLEFGEGRGEGRTLKAEIEFPVDATLSYAAPFERVVYKEGQSSCAFCHSNESPDDTIEFADAFVSTAYRPARHQDFISVAELAAELSQCDAETEPHRCAMLHGLFAQGMPVDREFPVEFATFQ